MVKLSIVIPILEEGKELDRTIDSIELQKDTLAFVEVIIVCKSNNMTDGKIVNLSIGQSMAKIYYYDDTGEYDAMNYGVTLASGKYVQILCAGDEYYAHDTLKNLMPYFNTKDIVFGDLIYTTPGGGKVIRYWKSSWSKNDWKYGKMIPHPSTFISREFHKKVGFYNLNYDVVADYELLMRALVKHKADIKHVKQVIVRMDTGGRSYGGIAGGLEQHGSTLDALKKLDLNPGIMYFPMKAFDRWKQYINALIYFR